MSGGSYPSGGRLAGCPLIGTAVRVSGRGRGHSEMVVGSKHAMAYIIDAFVRAGAQDKQAISVERG